MVAGRLLVVMDDEHARGLLVAVLRSDGYPVDALALPALVFVTQPAFTPDLARFLMESAAPLLQWPARRADISRIVARPLAPTPA